MISDGSWTNANCSLIPPAAITQSFRFGAPREEEEVRLFPNGAVKMPGAANMVIGGGRESEELPSRKFGVLHLCRHKGITESRPGHSRNLSCGAVDCRTFHECALFTRQRAIMRRSLARLLRSHNVYISFTLGCSTDDIPDQSPNSSS